MVVRMIQQRCPEARVLYCFATQAFRRLETWRTWIAWAFGVNRRPSKNADDFIDKLRDRGVGFLEMLAIEMKAREVRVARALSFEEAEFCTETIKITAEQRKMDDSACQIWHDVRKLFLILSEKRGEKSKHFMNLYWSAHQRFFKLLCVSFKSRSSSRRLRKL